MANCKKPRVRLCWLCGKKLYGNHHTEVTKPEDGHTVIMHKLCAKKYADGDE